MPPKPVPIITDGVHGQPPINFYPASDSEKGVILQPTPGLEPHVQLTDCSEVRGCDPDEFLGYMYFVARRGSQSVLWRVDSSGSASEVGNFSTSFTGPVYMVHSTDTLSIGDGVTDYNYFPATGQFKQVTDTNFPGAGTIDAQDGYLLFTFLNSRSWGISKLFDFTAYDAGQFYVKEGKPDNVVVIKSLLREPWICGEKSIEVWGNVGGFTPNPTFQRNPGGLLEYGVGAAASVNIVNSKMMWLSDKRQWLQAIAYQPSVKSNQMMERSLGKMAAVSDAIAFGYTQDGHVFNILTLPNGNETWVWDDGAGVLHKRQSYLDDGSGWGRWRGNCCALSGNQYYIGDYGNGMIYKLRSDYYSDNGKEIRREFYLKEVDGGGTLIKFPDIEIGFKSGQGNVVDPGSDPQVMLQFSADQGNTWTSEVWRSAGKIGEYGQKLTWTEMGEGYWRQYRVAVTDPIFWQILSVSEGD